MPPPPEMRSLSNSMPEGFEQASVLVFNAGQDNEDICVGHPTQGGRPPSVLAFETTHDAEKFAQILKADGLDATPIRWDADQLTSLCQQTGMDVFFVPRGELPPPPGGNQRGDPERKYPGDGTMRPDAYTAHRPRLEELLDRTPENCDDDDCTIPVDAASLHPDAAMPQDRLRKEAFAAIDAILTTYNNTMDLTTLMKRAWQSVKADMHEKQSDEEE